MALIRKNYTRIKAGKCSLSVNRSTGVIRIMKGLSDTLVLNDGDFIAFYQDDENKKNWFLAKETNGFLVKKDGSNNCKNFKVLSKHLAQDLLNSIDVDSDFVRINVSATKENEMFAIITSSAVAIK